MKKNLIILTTVFFIGAFGSQQAFAKSKKMPEWVQDYRQVYPNSEYLVQRGIGDSAEKAQNDATAALSRYFKTNVNSNLSTTMSSVTTGSNSSIEEKTVVVDDVQVQSEVEFFGLEYTEPFYYKAEKKWYCVVYMNRKEAWNQYKPQIEMKKDSFMGLYKNLTNESDYFTRLGMCQKVWASAEELLEKLEYARIINSEQEESYRPVRDNIAEIPVIFEEAKSNCSVYIDVIGDWKNTVELALAQALSECGFRISKTDADSFYTANVIVEENMEAEEPLEIRPTVEVNINAKSGKTVWTYSVSAQKKTLAYSPENARKKAYPPITEDLKDGVKANLSPVFEL